MRTIRSVASNIGGGGARTTAVEVVEGDVRTTIVCGQQQQQRREGTRMATNNTQHTPRAHAQNHTSSCGPESRRSEHVLRFPACRRDWRRIAGH